MKIAFLLLCLVSAVVAAIRSKRIHGGWYITEDMKDRIFPFVVSIVSCKLWPSTKCFRCTGSLMTSDKVITAAHCVCEWKDVIWVYYNSITLSNKGSLNFVQTTKVKFHKKYICGKSDYYHLRYDIAIIILTENLTDVRPVELECRNAHVGEKIYMIGYGNDARGNYGKLKAADQNATSCPKEDGVICAELFSPNRMDIGDSGGPLMVKRDETTYAQIGVQNGFQNYTIPGKPTVALQVAARIDQYCKRECSFIVP